MTHALADGAAGVRLVVALLLRQLTAHLERAVVDRLEDLLVQLLRLGALERVAHAYERVGQALHADADRPVTTVRPLRLRLRNETKL